MLSITPAHTPTSWRSFPNDEMCLDAMPRNNGSGVRPEIPLRSEKRTLAGGSLINPNQLITRRHDGTSLQPVFLIEAFWRFAV
jgi:hypothetical protein